MDIDESVFDIINVINKRWINKFKKEDESDNKPGSEKSEEEWLAKTQELERKISELQNKMQLVEERCGLPPLDTEKEKQEYTTKTSFGSF